MSHQDHPPDSGPPARDETGGAVATQAVDNPPEFRVWIADDRLAVLVDCPDPHAALAMAVTRVAAQLAELHLAHRPDAETLAARLAAGCAPGEHLRALPVVTGTPPVPAEDGRLEWADDFFATGFEVDAESGAVDYWSRVDRRAVRTDQLLATIVPPVPGQDGVDVLGNPLKVPEPSRARLKPGKNVTATETETGIFYRAKAAGRLRYQDGTVAVDEVYVIKGNVSLETGNIRHTGAVSIEGDVQTGARLEVEGEIVVRGMLEPCTIVGGGNLTVAGGIVGNDDHLIRVEGHVQARYVREARIDATGDVLVAGEISHARIRTRGKVVAASGRLAGGVTVARQGIKVAHAGAEGASSTELVAGVDPFLDEILAGHHARRDKLEQARATIARALAGVARRQDALSDDEQRAARTLEENLQQILAALEQVQAAATAAERAAHDGALAKVVVLQEILAGCVIQLERARLRVPQSVSKPRIAELKRGRVRLLPLGDGNCPEQL